MYEYVNGLLQFIDDKIAIVDVQGIGYKLFVPSKLCEQSISLDKPTKFYVAHVVREDSESLFGFMTKEERDLFLKLSSVSGIGPKTALAILSHLDIDTFFNAITNHNALLLSKVPGIGKKTAERLILDMKDKIGSISIPTKKALNPKANDALSALMNLGHDPRKAQKVVQSILSENADIHLSDIIKEAMRKL